MNNKLKPCPFCGSDDVHIRVHCNEEGEEVSAQIECYGCVSIYVKPEAINQEELISAWNRRADGKRENLLCWSKQGLYPDGFGGARVGIYLPLLQTVRTVCREILRQVRRKSAWR